MAKKTIEARLKEAFEADQANYGQLEALDAEYKAKHDELLDLAAKIDKIRNGLAPVYNKTCKEIYLELKGDTGEAAEKA